MNFSLATFNVRDLLAAPPAGNTRAVRLHRTKVMVTGDTVARLAADVIAFQEVGSAGVLDAVRARLPDHASYHPAVVASPDARGIGCGLLSRFPIVSTVDHAHSPLALPPFREGDDSPGTFVMRRGVLEATLALPDGTALTVIVVHLKSNRPTPLLDVHGNEIGIRGGSAHAAAIARSLLVRTAEAMFVRTLVESVFDRKPRAQLAVCGDFNDVENSVAVRAVAGDPFDGIEGDAGDADGVSEDRWLRACAHAVPDALRFSAMHEGAGVQIDHVLVSPALWQRFESARFLNETLRQDLAGMTVAAGGSLASDHAPLRAVFR